MSPGSCLRVALAAISKNRLQTALTMIGLMIGVATVLTMIALGSGAQTAIQDQVKSAGMNLVVVTPGNHTRKLEDESGMMDDPGSPEELQASVQLADAAGETVQKPLETSAEPKPVFRGTATLSMSDADAIRQVAGVQYVSQGVHDNTRVTVGDKQVFTRLHGDDTFLPLIRRAWKFSAGRFYTAAEEKEADEVVVLGSVVAQQLFGGDNPVGQTITLLGKPFQVIGVVGSGNWMVAAAAGDDQFDAVYVPYSTLQRLLKVTSFNDISATAASSGDVTRVVKGIIETLRKRHQIHPAQQDDFTVTSQARKALATGGMRPEVAHAVVGNVNGLEKVTLAELSKTLDRASRTMTALLASVAAVSLLVGGIGIMNVMLLSVTERTKEIGIRRAIGARSKDVLLQFLLEATTLSLAGGVAGIVLGVTISIAISRWATWTASVSGVSVVLSFGVAAMVGIFFGYYPARRAAEVAPIESLRYE